MKDIDSLEHGGGDFKIRFDGYLMDMPDPREMHYQQVLVSLAVGHVRWTPGNIPEHKRAAVFERWCAAWDLPSFNDARRLAYLVDHYRGALVWDLRVLAGLDLGEEWRARRWRTLIDTIDRLPGHSHYSAAMANDEEYAQIVADAHAARKRDGNEPKDPGPALTTWSPEVAALTQVLDAVNQVRYAVVAVQAGKKAGEPPKPARRPQTALEKAMRRAEYDRRKSAHESLVARVLPKRREPGMVTMATKPAEAPIGHTLVAPPEPPVKGTT